MHTDSVFCCCPFVYLCHLRVTVAGELREEQVRDMFMTSFSGTQERGEVSYAEFEEYYEGLSVGVPSDDDYINILKNAWGV